MTVAVALPPGLLGLPDIGSLPLHIPPSSLRASAKKVRIIDRHAVCAVPSRYRSPWAKVLSRLGEQPLGRLHDPNRRMC